EAPAVLRLMAGKASSTVGAKILEKCGAWDDSGPIRLIRPDRPLLVGVGLVLRQLGRWSLRGGRRLRKQLPHLSQMCDFAGSGGSGQVICSCRVCQSNQKGSKNNGVCLHTLSPRAVGKKNGGLKPPEPRIDDGVVRVNPLGCDL